MMQSIISRDRVSPTRVGLPGEHRTLAALISGGAGVGVEWRDGGGGGRAGETDGETWDGCDCTLVFSYFYSSFSIPFQGLFSSIP